MLRNPSNQQSFITKVTMAVIFVLTSATAVVATPLPWFSNLSADNHEFYLKAYDQDTGVSSRGRNPSLIVLSALEVNNIAREITVLIESQFSGSGIIIARNQNTYYVLTAAHVVQHADLPYTIVTSSGSRYSLKYNTVRKLPGVDLAILEFTSSRTYATARFANSDQSIEGTSIYVTGFPELSDSVTERAYRFSAGMVTSRPANPFADGYAMVYDNLTVAGMSGGPILDSNGRVIGIHGRAETAELSSNQVGISYDVRRTFHNYGIPINTFFQLASQVNLNVSSLGIRVEANLPTNTQPTAMPSSPTPPPIYYVPSTPRNGSVCPGRRC